MGMTVEIPARTAEVMDNSMSVLFYRDVSSIVVVE
jgi:hypothetical protein